LILSMMAVLSGFLENESAFFEQQIIEKHVTSMVPVFMVFLI